MFNPRPHLLPVCVALLGAFTVAGCVQEESSAKDERVGLGKADGGAPLCLPDPSCSTGDCEPVCLVLGQEFVDVSNAHSCAGRCGEFADFGTNSCDCDFECDLFPNGCCDDIVLECAGGQQGDTCTPDQPCSNGLQCTYEAEESCFVDGVCTPLMACDRFATVYCDCNGETQPTGSGNCLPGPFVHVGACDDAGGIGDRCNEDDPCNAGLQCLYTAGESCDQGGECVAPIACKQDTAVYCSCDGETRNSGSSNCLPEPFAALGDCG